MLDSRAGESGKLQLIAVTRLDREGPELPTNLDQILRESGLVPPHGSVVVRLDKDSDGVPISVGGIERFIRDGVLTTD
jgi:hypothetical protein